MYTDFCSILHRIKCILSSGKYGNITTMCITIYFKSVPMTAALLALVCLKHAANQCLSSYTTNYFQPSVPEETPCIEQNTLISTLNFKSIFNPLNPKLNPICYLLALLGAHHFLHVSRIRVKLLTFRLLMSYIYIYIWSTHS